MIQPLEGSEKYLCCRDFKQEPESFHGIHYGNLALEDLTKIILQHKNAEGLFGVFSYFIDKFSLQKNSITLNR